MYERILTLLKARGENFSILSSGTGISESVFSNLKKRGGNLSIKNAKAVADYLGVGIEELTGGNE